MRFRTSSDIAVDGTLMAEFEAALIKADRLAVSDAASHDPLSQRK
ncbi:hypothetical protein ABIA95_009184 [Bradyrhizobium sp. LA8.1]